jgi:EmrB/QacA subfamily drug resistance transporter
VTATLAAERRAPVEAAAGARRGLVLFLLCTAQFVVVLDMAIVNVALPSIQHSLGFTLGTLAWVVNAYTVMFGGFLLLGGRLADRLGRRRAFLSGLALFGIASLACGLAGSPGLLIAARAAQGLGAAVASPAALALLTTTFREGPERNRAFGVWGAVAGSGGAAGVLFGGLLTDLLSWPWIFFLNVPVCIAVIALARYVLPEGRSARPAVAAGSQPARFDLAGAVTITAALMLFVFAVVTSSDYGWGARTLASLGGAVVLLAVFFAVERRAADPMLPFAIFRHRTAVGANLVILIATGVGMGTFYLLSLYMQQVLGYSPLRTGLGFLAVTLAVVVTSTAARKLVTRFGVTPLLIAGLGLTMLSRLWLSRITADGTYPVTLLPGLLLTGVGIGLMLVSASIAAVSGAGSAQAGIAAALFNTAQQTGGALGVAVMSTLALARSHHYLQTHASTSGLSAHAAVSGFAAAFLLAAALATVGLVVALVLLRPKRSAAVDLSRGAVIAFDKSPCRSSHSLAQ